MKNIIAFLTIFFFIVTNQAFAHTALQSSVPADGEIVEEPLQEIVLKYATKIENGSTFEVKNSKDEIVEMNITLETDVLKGVTSEPLPNDEYILDWNIIGADGHLIKGSLAFRVNVSEQAQEELVKEENEEAEEHNVQQEPAAEKNEPVEQQTTDESFSAFPVVLVIVLGIIALGSLFFLRKRKG